jgi:hypothetical protein
MKSLFFIFLINLLLVSSQTNFADKVSEKRDTSDRNQPAYNPLGALVNCTFLPTEFLVSFLFLFIWFSGKFFCFLGL